jgi:hypothetical protein
MFDSVPIGGIALKFPQFDAPKLTYFSPVISTKKYSKSFSQLHAIARGQFALRYHWFLL